MWVEAPTLCSIMIGYLLNLVSWLNGHFRATMLYGEEAREILILEKMERVRHEIMSIVFGAIRIHGWVEYVCSGSTEIPSIFLLLSVGGGGKNTRIIFQSQQVFKRLENPANLSESL
jgi:hypothetical protein